MLLVDSVNQLKKVTHSGDCSFSLLESVGNSEGIFIFLNNLTFSGPLKSQHFNSLDSLSVFHLEADFINFIGKCFIFFKLAVSAVCINHLESSNHVLVNW